MEFYLNGEKRCLQNPSENLDLLAYLRDVTGLCGTKKACGTGGCGSCTVTISKKVGDNLTHHSAYACLVKVCSLSNTNVTTVEGLGNVRTGLHPVQSLLAQANGSQCGFCSPGMVMSMYSLLQSKPVPDIEDVQSCLEGNLCRCTGYRPILEAYQTFCSDGNKQGVSEFQIEDGEEVLRIPNAEEFKEKIKSFSSDKQFIPNATPLKSFSSKEGNMWHRPESLIELKRLLAKNENYRIYAGGTGNFQTNDKRATDTPIIQITSIPELHTFTTTSSELIIGSGMSISKVKQAIEEINHKKTAHRLLQKCCSSLASKQVRDLATIGGWVMWNHPASDIRPVLIALNARVKVLIDGSEKEISVESFINTSFENSGVILEIKVPLYASQKGDFLKRSRRKTFDLAIANAAVVANFDGNHIEKISIATGGNESDFPGSSNGRTCKLTKLCNFLEGKNSTDIRRADIEKWMLEDGFSIDPRAPGYLSKLRLSVISNFLISFLNGDQRESKVEARKQSCLTFQKPNADQPIQDPVTRPIPHMWADEQVAGTAMYLDDIKPYPNELQLTPIQSTRAHAKVLKIDFSRALEIPGVIDVMTGQHVENNVWGFIIPDEAVMAAEEVKFYGQIMGVVLSETKEAGVEALNKIEILYQDLPATLTLADAMQSKSFLGGPITLSRNQFSEEELNNETKSNIKGYVKLGGQETLYLEPNCALAVPNVEKDELVVYHSTQSPSSAHQKISQVLGLPQHKISVKVKRVGGGFGGKERIHIALIVAAVAHKYQRPARLVFSRKTDMEVSGHRHEVLANYDVDFNKNGLLLKTRVEGYVNAGCSVDMSEIFAKSVSARLDSGYTLRNHSGEFRLCETNTQSNTAMRGFGGPEGALITEHILERVAHELGMDPVKVREANFTKDGDRLHYADNIIQGCTLKECWDECLKRGKYDTKLDDIKKFNGMKTDKRRGIAITPLMFAPSFCTKFLAQGGALIRIYVDGSVLLSHGGVEIGQGLNTKMIQVASRALGIPYDKIHIVETSTETVPNTSSTGASCGADLNGPAVIKACKTLLERLAPIKEQNPNGTWEEWIFMAYLNKVNLSAVGFYDESKIDFNFEKNCGIYSDYWTYGAGLCEVEVDVNTADVTVLAVNLVMDVGKSLNPAIDIGQIEGAFIQAQGYVTTEQLLINPSTGQLVTNSPSSYKIPNCSDVPKSFDVHLLRNEKGPTSATYSSKGIGEPAFIIGANSVLLAIRSAVASFRNDRGIDKWFQISLPATADKILAALHEDEFEHYFQDKQKIAMEV